jgi:hypothetical protein
VFLTESKIVILSNDHLSSHCLERLRGLSSGLSGVDVLEEAEGVAETTDEATKETWARTLIDDLWWRWTIERRWCVEWGSKANTLSKS